MNREQLIWLNSNFLPLGPPHQFFAGELNIEYISKLAVLVYMEHKTGLPLIKLVTYLCIIFMILLFSLFQESQGVSDFSFLKNLDVWFFFLTFSTLFCRELVRVRCFHGRNPVCFYFISCIFGLLLNYIWMENNLLLFSFGLCVSWTLGRYPFTVLWWWVLWLSQMNSRWNCFEMVWWHRTTWWHLGTWSSMMGIIELDTMWWDKLNSKQQFSRCIKGIQN